MELEKTSHSQLPRTQDHGRRILILYSDIGEGHLSAARNLRSELELEAPSSEVVLENGFEALGRLLAWFMRDFYRQQYSSLPRLYGFCYELVRRLWLFRALGAFILSSLGGRGLNRRVLSHSPDLVISTDARLNAVLGHLRKSGRLKVPVFATLTDLAGLEFWVHKGVDLHLVMDAECVAEVERLAGGGSARQVRPLVDRRFFLPMSRQQARAKLGLPLEGKVVLVSGGGWGIGHLEGAIRGALLLPDTRVVCVTGHNESARTDLQERYRDEPRVVMLGFTPMMNELIAAADAVVHSIGGVTYLEAIVRDRPVIAYDPPAGHARRIAKVLTDRGRQWLATGPEQVPSTLLAAFDPCARGTVARAWPPSAASVVLSASARVLPRPPWHASALRVAAIVVLVTLLSGVTFFVDDSYSVLAKTLHLQSARPAAVDSTSVVLVIRSSSRAVPHAVAELENHGQSASFVFADARTPVALDAIAHSNDQLLPALELNPRTGWPHLRRYLKEQVAEATGGSFVYLPPRDGFTLSEYLLARSAGALPLSGATWLDLRGLVAGRAMKHGSVLVVDVESKTTGSPDLLRSVLDELSHRHLKAVPVGFGAEPVRSSVKARAA